MDSCSSRSAHFSAAFGSSPSASLECPFPPVPLPMKTAAGARHRGLTTKLRPLSQLLHTTAITGGAVPVGGLRAGHRPD